MGGGGALCPGGGGALPHVTLYVKWTEKSDMIIAIQMRQYNNISDIIQDGHHECNGFNVALARNQGHSVNHAMTAIYTPLVDETPHTRHNHVYNDRSATSRQCGQTITVFALRPALLL